MKVLVTGSAGFIGSAVKATLASRGMEPVPYDLPRDIRNEVGLSIVGAGCKHVIHLAGKLGTHELFDNPHEAIDVNVHGTLNVLDWAHRNDAGYTGITMPQVFPSIYTATKVAGTRLASAFHHTYGLPVSHVRAFNAFGPGQAYGPGHPQKIIPALAVAAWLGEPAPIWGDGEQGVDLIYTADLADMLCDVMEFGHDEVFDGGTCLSLSVNTVNRTIQLIVAEAGGPDPVPANYLLMRRGETPTVICATGENWDRLPAHPTFRHDDLLHTVYWYRDVAARVQAERFSGRAV